MGAFNAAVAAAPTGPRAGWPATIERKTRIISSEDPTGAVVGLGGDGGAGLPSEPDVVSSPSSRMRRRLP